MATQKYAVLDIGGPQPGGEDKRYRAAAPHNGNYEVDAKGVPRVIPMGGARTDFALLPAATVTVATDLLIQTVGTGTEVIARSNKGGASVTTQSSTPTIGDNALLFGVSGSAMRAVIVASAGILFRAVVGFNTDVSTGWFGSFGLDENLTDADPSGTAGDGAMFCFVPDGAAALTVATGLTAANHLCWICHTKVDGADAYQATAVPVQLNRDYLLEIQLGDDLKPKFYIDGVLVATGATALTSGDTVGAKLGIENVEDSAQNSFECRMVQVARNIG